MNNANSGLTTVNFSSNWLFLPPVVAILTIMLTRFFSSEFVVPVDPAIWGLVGLMFVALSILYGIFIKRNFARGFLPVQLVAQGILLCPLSLHTGALMFSWVGVIMAICGAVILVALFHQSYSNTDNQMTAIPRTAPPLELDNLPLPFAITDAKGNIISVSKSMLQLAQKGRNAVDGEKIDVLLPLDKETAHMGGKEWRILQTPIEDGALYFQLEEVHNVIVASPGNDTETNVIDPVTSLYNRPYAIKRIEEELYRIFRYKRCVSAALLRVNFLEGEAADHDSKREDDIFNAYCRFIGSSTRETDVVCLAAPREILVVMPETQLDGAQDVVSKLLDFTAHLREEIREFNDPMEVTEKTIFFNSFSGILDFDRLMEKLDETQA